MTDAETVIITFNHEQNTEFKFVSERVHEVSGTRSVVVTYPKTTYNVKMLNALHTFLQENFDNGVILHSQPQMEIEQ